MAQMYDLENYNKYVLWKVILMKKNVFMIFKWHYLHM